MMVATGASSFFIALFADWRKTLLQHTNLNLGPTPVAIMPWSMEQ
jgi:hypothetical protein